MVTSLKGENEQLTNTVADLQTQVLKYLSQNENFSQTVSDLSVRLEFERKVSDQLKSEVQKL